jgi:hypothetical protein
MTNYSNSYDKLQELSITNYNNCYDKLQLLLWEATTNFVMSSNESYDKLQYNEKQKIPDC